MAGLEYLPALMALQIGAWEGVADFQGSDEWNQKKIMSS